MTDHNREERKARTMVRGVLHAALRAASSVQGENREEQERD